MQQPWALWRLQAKRLTQIELRRNLFSWRATWIYFLAFIPTLIIFIHILFNEHDASSFNDDTQVLAGIIQLYYIRLGVFFGCLGIFSRLIRGEMIERSLHFYLLSPVRREVLLLSKFAAGSAAAVLLFVTATIVDFALMYLPFGAAGRDYVFNGPGLGQLEAYVLIIVLACLGYGAVFLLLSMVFKNPTPGALLFLGWEAINPVLPSILQRLSVASYLRHLMPVDVGAKGFIALLTVETEPVSGLAATLGLLLLITAVLLYSCYRIRTLEIRYTTE
ncbi:ABC-type transport system involved in multi-copper enzyme maturation permease subunit [Granulicella aggregans]|uniref:ABC-type transport system involved in multi-copper enzyme maturation permease subunit n=1 Tax=Granulicella aggregans TaxID=474949 RepID=A0A7W7ZBH0_9BACT|nr:ABC transporter permease [Granulicella aggregans]MBB5056835.1 ABC-type transport system involved in multi-copper enzyme maturation permease subunit [Granulicella aggregans]